MRLLPTPRSVAWGSGELALADPVVIHGENPAAAILAERLLVAAGVRSQPGPAHASTVRFSLDPALAPEGYRLCVDDAGVSIASADRAGAGWAVQTLLQLLPPFVYGCGPMDPAGLRVPHVLIADEPRHRWRGSMIDVARHFLPLDGLMRHLEVMAMHKLNVLHLHLTDDQGWRLPVPSYPLLTQVGGWRPGTIAGHQPPPEGNDCDDFSQHDGRPHGGSYSATDIERIVRRAANLGITVVPEIDMPGHMEAAIAAYPWLGACDHVRHPRTCWGVSEHVLALSADTLGFCREVLDTAMRLFPDAPVHVGGDECPGSEWLTDETTRATAERFGFTDRASAQAWFERQICEHVTAAGRRVIAWDEVLDGDVPQNVTVMAWRDLNAAVRAAEAGHDIIVALADVSYLDRAQHCEAAEPLAHGGITTQEQVATFADRLAMFSGEYPGKLLGGQFQLWTEYVHDWARAEYQLWPRGSSMAQQLWAGHAGDSGSVAALGEHLDRLTAMGLNWCRPLRGFAEQAASCES